MISMRFEGGQELANMLDQLSVHMSAKVMRDALKDGGELIRKHAASIAPRAPGAPDIAENIGISAARVRGGGQEMAAVKIGPTKPGFAYGLPLEIGSAKAAAQPFMRPAFDAQSVKALGVIGRSLWVELARRGVQRRASISGGLSGRDAFTDTGVGR